MASLKAHSPPFCTVRFFLLQLLLLYTCSLTTYLVLQTGTELSQAVLDEVPNVQKTSVIPGWDPLNPLSIPAGQAQNLPSIRVEDKSLDDKRNIYGGTGDKVHLGGFTEYDGMGVSPATWKHMIESYGVHSLLDVGCGRGISTTWFLKHGVDVLCAEGSHDAVTKTLLPEPEKQIVEHDFSRGPWWPEKTYDAVWAVEFLEHVGVQYHFNYITAFRKSALLFVTSSRWGGWHHTEIHSDDWWIRKYESYGFHYSQKLTDEMRNVAKVERTNGNNGPDGKPFNAQHIWLTMKVFINPMVASLPQHAHLFPEKGCFGGKENKQIIGRDCGTGENGEMETPLPPDFHPLKLTPAMDEEWNELVKKSTS